MINMCKSKGAFWMYMCLSCIFHCYLNFLYFYSTSRWYMYMLYIGIIRSVYHSVRPNYPDSNGCWSIDFKSGMWLIYMYMGHMWAVRLLSSSTSYFLGLCRFSLLLLWSGVFCYFFFSYTIFVIYKMIKLVYDILKISFLSQNICTRTYGRTKWITCTAI